LSSGQVGYILASMKDVSDVKLGDTITSNEDPCITPLPGYKDVKPMVFAGIYPIDPDNYIDFKDALEKLKLNDSSLLFSPDSSNALGFGFRCGFLGLLHLEILQERIYREFNIEILTTAPSVEYKINYTDGNTLLINNPSEFPSGKNFSIEEPYVDATIVVNEEYIGKMLGLIQEKRGQQKGIHYFQGGRVEISADLPLSEIIFDFYDKLKTLSKGYASFNYDISSYRSSNLVKLDILINNECIDALSCIVHHDHAEYYGRNIIKRLQKQIPRHMFKIPLQASIFNKIVAREDIPALRKDVTSKCYGGDISRKRKLLEKQKSGKARMKSVGKISIPQKAFFSVLSIDENEN